MTNSFKGFFESALALTVSTPSGISVQDLQLIVGIPPSTTSESKQWREIYKRRIEQALGRIGLRKPRFWPEPFAVFQYLMNRGSVPDTGAHQNVLIVDVGGGTTNVCLIQTTKHGRLARGGRNHVPHGVKSVQVGGSTLDLRLAEAVFSTDIPVIVQSVLPFVKSARERITLRLNEEDAWSTHDPLPDAEQSITHDGDEYCLSAEVIRGEFLKGVWPGISAAISESLDEVMGRKLANPIETH